MSPDYDHPFHQASLSGSDELTTQVEGLIRLVQSGQEVNIKLAFLIGKSLGNPAPLQQYLDRLMTLYQLAFNSQRKKKLDAVAIIKLFQLNQLDLKGRELTALPLPRSPGPRQPRPFPTVPGRIAAPLPPCFR